MVDFDAGRYAAFVWPAYAITLATFAAMIIASLAHARRWRRRAQQAKQPEQKP